MKKSVMLTARSAFLAVFLCAIGNSALASAPPPGMNPAKAFSEISSAGLQASARANIGVTGAVNSVASLKATSLTGLTAGTVMILNGQRSVGDAPAAAYTWSNSVCTLNVGLGDGNPGGSQIPNTAGGCWNVVPVSVVDARTFGAIGGGTDPYYTSGNTGNALSWNNYEAYLTSLKNTNGFQQSTTSNSGGLVYMVDYPVTISGGQTHQTDLSFALGSAGVTAGNFPSTSAVVILSGSTSRYIDSISVDVNDLTANGVGDEATGTGITRIVNIKHWFGHFSSNTTGTVATPTVGSNVILLSASPASLGLSTGMIASGSGVNDNGARVGTGYNCIMPRSIITGAYTSPNSIVVSKACQAAKASFTASISGTSMFVNGMNYNAIDNGDTISGAGITGSPTATYASGGYPGGLGTYTLSVSQGTIASEAMTVPLTQTGTVPLTFSLDPSGFVCGLNGQNAGNTFDSANIFEYSSSDAQININSDQFGFGIWATSACTNQNWGEAQVNEAVSPIFVDTNSSGISFHELSTFNATYNIPEFNAPSVVRAVEAGALQISDWSLNAPAQFFADSAETPVIQITGYMHDQRASSVIASPAATIQMWDASSSTTDGHNIFFDPWAYSGPTSTVEWAYVGGGIYNPSAMLINLGQAVLSNPLIADGPTATGTTFGPTNCGEAIHLNTQSATTFILPDTLQSVTNNTACQIFLYTNLSPVTIQNATTGLLDGINENPGVLLASNTMYIISTAGITGGILNWEMTPPVPLQFTPCTKTPTSGTSLGQACLATGVVIRTGPTTAFTDTTATAQQLQNQMTNISSGLGYPVRIMNESTVVETIAGGTNVTTSGTMTIAAGTWRDFRVIANTITGTAATTIEDVGGGNIN